ncbi:MAG: CopG family transcriptional regulator [Candidatus Asgardarchaeia archaeon]
MTGSEGKKRKFTTISIPVPLYEKVKKLIKGTGFTSVSDYVTFILREILASVEEDLKKEPFTKEDEERIKRRLKALGYL